jgi:hypothetical protein
MHKNLPNTGPITSVICIQNDFICDSIPYPPSTVFGCSTVKKDESAQQKCAQHPLIYMKNHLGKMQHTHTHTHTDGKAI